MAITHLPEPHPSDPIVTQLSQMYAAAYDATLADLQQLAARGLSTRYKAQVLLRLARRRAELRAQTLAWAYGPLNPVTGARRLNQAALYRAVAIADRQALTQLAAIGITVEVPAAGAVSASFALLNDTAVQAVARNMVISLDLAATQFDRSVQAIIGRAENDVFRRAGLQTVGEKLTEGLTVRQGRARLVNTLTEKGITAFTDSRNVDWNLKSYSDMVIRTTTREATSRATLQRVEAEGMDYLIATTHQPTCPLCALRQGRVYCISGTDSRFPALSTVGNTPWHPNCGHSLVPWSENYEPNLQAVIAASNASFDVDPRSTAEVANYTRAQKIKLEQRNKRKLTTSLAVPGLDPKAAARLKRLRNAANERLIKLNKAQRTAIKGWR